MGNHNKKPDPEAWILVKGVAIVIGLAVLWLLCDNFILR